MIGEQRPAMHLCTVRDALSGFSGRWAVTGDMCSELIAQLPSHASFRTVPPFLRIPND